MIMKYDQLNAYRDATILLSSLVKIIINSPRPIQTSIGSIILCDALDVAQLINLRYYANSEKKGCYAEEIAEKMIRLGVAVNQLTECGILAKKKTANLYKTIGAIQTWINSEIESNNN